MRLAESGIQELQKSVDTLIVIPNQNLFRIANDKTTFADAFAMADQVLYSGVACITDLMVKEGLINLDFADVRSVMREMGRAMMGTGEASGEGRAMQAAEAAIANPLLDETSMKGAQGLLISITGGRDLTLFEVDEAATRIREEVDPDANIILGATFDESLEGIIRVSVVATGIDRAMNEAAGKNFQQIAEADYPSFRGRCSGAGRSRLQPVDAAGTEDRRFDRSRPSAWRKPNGTRTRNPRSCARGWFSSTGSAGNDSVRRAKSLQRRKQQPIIRPAPVLSGLCNAGLQQPVHPGAGSQQPAPVMQQQPVRMPKVEDFPPMVKAEDRASFAAEPGSHAHEERGPMGLLKRITNSLGRREEETHVASDMTSAPAAASQQRRPLSPEASLYAPRRGNLDDQGRSVPQARDAGRRSARNPGFPSPPVELIFQPRIATCRNAREFAPGHFVSGHY
jgi:cell division protein FtsZ